MDNNNQNWNNDHQAPVVVTSTFSPCRQKEWEAKLWLSTERKQKMSILEEYVYRGHDSPDEAAIFLFN